MQITRHLKQAVQKNTNGIATIDVASGRRRTWREFANRVTKLAGTLLSSGLVSGDRVAVLTQNSDVHLEYYFATIWAGGIFVPLNYRLKPGEIFPLLKDCGAEILIVDDYSYLKLGEILYDSSVIRTLIYAGRNDAPEKLINHESFLNSGESVSDAERGGDDVAIIIYTGGTTGTPKGAMLTHKNIISNSKSALQILNDDKSWVYLHTAPMYHIADCQWSTGVTMIACTHVFLDKFDPEQVLSAIDRFKITHTALVPTMIKMLCDVPNIHSYDLSSLRKINFGGSPISPELIKKARKSFPDCKFIQGYGLTETSPNISMLPDRYNTTGNPKITSAGRPVTGMSVKIVDKNGDEVPRETIGEIITKGSHVMAGYWNNPKETEQMIRNSWLYTGDLGYMDEDGFIFIVDRLKDMIITGGENVYSSEVEAVINNMESMDSCAVIGIPHEKWGETVHAIVVIKKNQKLTEEQVIHHCRKYLADYKCPKSVEFRQESLPMSGPGKTLKRELREPFWSRDNHQAD